MQAQASVINFDIHAKLAESFKTIEEVLTDLKSSTDPRLKLAAAAELRKLTVAAGRILEAAARAEHIREFQTSVLDALAEAGITLRRRILTLFESRAANAHSTSPSDQ